MQEAPVFNIAREPGTKHNSFFYHILDGLHYHRSHERPGTIYLKCVYYERGCRGRAIIDDHDGFVHRGAHNHDPDLHYPEEMEVRRRILQRCRNLDYAPFSRIVDEELAGAHQEVRIRIFVARMRTSMRNARLENYPNLPHDLRGLSAILMNPQNAVITMTLDGEDNLYAGSTTDANGGHHVLLISQRMLRVAASMRTLHGDGTFKTTPAGLHVAQIFCIVAVWGHRNISIGWVLMENRSEVAYVAVFELLRHLMGPNNIHLTKVITDFEQAQQNAWLFVFVVRIMGCLWHACRCFLRAALSADIGLAVPMRDIPEVRRIVNLSMGLPLLPRRMMRIGLIVIRQEALDEGNYIYQLVEPYLRYLYTTWLRSDRTCDRLTVYRSEVRTNNACESQNHALNEALGVHPNTYACLEGLKKMEQKAYDLTIALDGGNRVGRGRKVRSILNDENLQQLYRDLRNRPGPLNQAVLRFLRRAALVMRGMVDEALN